MRAPLLPVAVTATLVVAGCAQASITADDKAPRTVVTPTPAAVPSAAPSAPPGPSSRFAEVARVPGGATLVRPTAGPVLVVTQNVNTAYALSASGEVSLVEPLSELGVTTETFPLTVGSIAGRWPLLRVTFAYNGGRDAPVVHSFRMDVATKTSTRAAAPDSITSSSPWIDDVEIAWRKSGVDGLTRGQVVVLEETGKRAPPPPAKGAAGFAPTLAGYRSGTVFLAASSWPKETEPLADDVLFLLEGGAWRTLPMTGKVDEVVRGRTETETLAYGTKEGDGAFLARWSGAAFVEVPLPRADARIGSVRAGDDGTVWLLDEAKPGDVSRKGQAVWQASFPELRFEKLDLPGDLVPVAVAGTSVKDVWVIADRNAAQKRRRSGAVVLHTQARAADPVPELPVDGEDVLRVLMARREAKPADAGCRHPFVVLGKDDPVVADADVRALSDAIGPPTTSEISSRAVVVRAPSGDALVGLEISGGWLLTGRAPTSAEVLQSKKALASARARHKDAKLVCARWPIVREP